MAFLTKNKATIQKFDISISFWEKRHFFRRKFLKIAEDCDHNIVPRKKHVSKNLILPRAFFFVLIFWHSPGLKLKIPNIQWTSYAGIFLLSFPTKLNFRKIKEANRFSDAYI
jgi:hypothetical protein